jgi:hypothetical protein
MLMMFCLKVFYLPCLKNLVTKTEKYNEVCMWYAQIVCYNVHVRTIAIKTFKEILMK